MPLPVHVASWPGGCPIDWLVVYDDELVQRLVACLLCGRRPEVLAIAHMRVGELALCIARCLTCRNRDATGTLLEALLLRRYAKDRYGCHT